MKEEVSPAGIASKIKGDGPIGYEDVVAGIAFAGDDPFSVKTSERRGFKVDPCQDMTCAVPEENAVRQLPPDLWVLLDAGFQSVHSVMIAPLQRNERQLLSNWLLFEFSGPLQLLRHALELRGEGYGPRLPLRRNQVAIAACLTKSWREVEGVQHGNRIRRR